VYYLLRVGKNDAHVRALGPAPTAATVRPRARLRGLALAPSATGATAALTLAF
jgi:hypothetical protein